MLAQAFFLATVAALLIIAGALFYFIVRPAWKRVARACDQVDALHTISEQERQSALSELGSDQGEQVTEQRSR